jgi:hypothetical protein
MSYHPLIENDIGPILFQEHEKAATSNRWMSPSETHAPHADHANTIMGSRRRRHWKDLKLMRPSSPAVSLPDNFLELLLVFELSF